MKLKFINSITPVNRLEWIEEYLELPFELFCKHDELTGFITSGNKIRKLEYLLKDALEKKADTVFTCGGIQSNHCRATALAARSLGMQPVLFLRGRPMEIPQGNVLLDTMVGSDIHYVTKEEYSKIDEIFATKKEEYEKKGSKVYLIPEGGSNALGARGYVDAVKELSGQINLDGVEAIFTAVGSAGTYAGLVAGLKSLGYNTRVIGVNVTKDPSSLFVEKTKQLIEGLKEYGIAVSLEGSEIEIVDDFSGPAYAVPSEEDMDLIKKLAKERAFFLDPVYTAKAFRGMLEISRGRFAGKRVLFIHTGGLFKLFDNPAAYVK
ncbi:1-aminocyclopropane-1-carboxylate deaminase/D-cysteine desulfhydrase [Mesotoga sp. B105.6.4]|uniref:1-aminocyclopropane-1-carboxylate deaminase/D-cysteine desulfhydrase n=1 Tax=Mesotoga sp. B105.6.4 TaxID=1582224 RepID=UPI000CCC0473|nr:D-cysteine desulfhydrase family protein [Mesotoga sp. B105.6.4]PNS35945.1 cysteine desulfhydrase [Mesotoga sp. B105.6.4]